MTRKQWTLAAAILGSGLVFLDAYMVNVALPRIGQDLPTRAFGVLEGQSYVANGYLLTLSALMILAGVVGDLYGHRRTFLVGLAGFGASSVLCGLAPDMELLVLLRLLQGAAGALLVPGSLALITATFEGEGRGRAIGIWASASGVTLILGPALGGLLVDLISWRAAFLINAPIVVAALWVTCHIRESRVTGARPVFDWFGAVLVVLSVGGLSFGTIYGQQREWQSTLAFVALAVGTLTTIAVPVWIARARNPLVPPSLFASRNFTVTNVSTLVIYGALYVLLYYLPLFMQGILGYSASAVGVALIPQVVFMVLLSERFGMLASRFGTRWFMATGPLIMAVGTVWLARVPRSSTPWVLSAADPTTYLPPTAYLVDILPGLVVFGLGLAIMVAPLTTALLSSVPVEHAGVASAINNSISRVGPQLAGALIFVAVTATFYSGLAMRVPGLDSSSPLLRQEVAPLNRPISVSTEVAAAAADASADAFRLAMLVCTFLLAGGGVINAIGIRDRRGPRAHRSPRRSRRRQALLDVDLAEHSIAFVEGTEIRVAAGFGECEGEAFTDPHCRGLEATVARHYVVRFNADVLPGHGGPNRHTDLRWSEEVVAGVHGQDVGCARGSLRGLWRR